VSAARLTRGCCRRHRCGFAPWWSAAPTILARCVADKLDVEFSLGSLMRGEWRATELTINGMALDLGLDAQGRIDWPASTGAFNLGSLAIDRLKPTGRITLHDAASRGTLELE